MSSRDEQGSALVEFVWLALILMVPLVYLLLSVFDVQRGSFGVASAARAAGRAYTLAESPAEGERRARAAARLALEDQGVDDGFDLDITCRPDPAACLAPGSVVTVRVRSQVVLPLVPDALGGGRPSFRVESVHRVPISEYVEAR